MLLEEKREQLKKSKEQEKSLEAEAEALQEEAKKKEKMVREPSWEERTVDPGPRGWQTAWELGAQQRVEGEKGTSQ